MVGREEFSCHFLYILCRNGIDLSEEYVQIALHTMMEIVSAEVKSKLLTIVAGYGYLPLQLSFGGREL